MVKIFDEHVFKAVFSLSDSCNMKIVFHYCVSSSTVNGMLVLACAKSDSNDNRLLALMKLPY